MSVDKHIIEMSRKLYQSCLDIDENPQRYVDKMRTPFMDGVLQRFMAEYYTDGLQNYTSIRDSLVEGFGIAAQEAGDNETANYVARLLAEGD